MFWNLPVIAKAVSLHRQHPFDAVAVTSPPWSLQLAGRTLGLLLRIPWIVDYRDPWNDVDRGHRTPAFEALNRRLEERLLHHATKVISTSDIFSGVLRDRFPRKDPDVFVTLHNGFDETKIPTERPAARRRFTLVHLGTLYELWEPHSLFAGIAAWLDANPGLRRDVVIRFVGRPRARTLARLGELGLTDVVEVTGFVNHATAIRTCREADALLLAMGDGRGVPAGWLPSKLFEYIAFGRPILANAPKGAAAHLIGGAQAGYILGDNDQAACAGILDDLYARKQAAPDNWIPWTNDPNAVARLTQRHLGRELVKILDDAVATHRAGRT